MAEITLQRPRRKTLHITVEGTAPLIVHNWSEKARREMLDKQMGKKVQKVVKDPQRDFESSRYQFADGSGDGFPVLAFKSATVTGAGRSFGKAVKMTELRQNLMFKSDGLSKDGLQLVRIQSPTPPVMREDMVRVGMGVADIRYRAMYDPWQVTLKVSFDPNVVDADSVLALVEAGGSNGVGEWRPEKDGLFGTYVVSDDVILVDAA